VIRVRANGGRTVRGEGLAPGATAYFDAAWLPRDHADIPALVVDGSGIRWNDGAPSTLSGEPDAIAAAALQAVAAEAVSRVPDDGLPVEVLGDGLVAAEVRRLLPPTGGGEGTRPRCVIDTTGDPEAIAEALGELEDRGTLVAAGPLGSRTFPLNLYADVHLRALRIVGVAPPLASGAVPDPAGTPVATPVTVMPGAPIGAGQWFRLEPQPA
jgi:hypothetical protein